MKHSPILTLAFLATMFVVACEKEQTTQAAVQDQIAVSERGCTVTTVLNNDGPGGNSECPKGYEHTSGRYEIDQEIYPQSSEFGPINWQISADGKYLSWSGNVCGLSVIVKGGNNSYTYTFSEECKSGSGLIAPPTQKGRTPQISNVTFCWNNCDNSECKDETAYGGNSAGDGPAWWYYFDTEVPACQNIYAGQTNLIGTVCYDGTDLTINLDGCATLEGDGESVKIQGYANLPTSRPASGQFKTYKGEGTVIPVSGFRYYVIHLDVVDCCN
jgi:hypothetical protein